MLEQSDEQYAPPEKDVLRVSVMGPDVYLDICVMQDDHKGTSLAPKASAIVPIDALVTALQQGMTAEKALKSSPQRRPDQGKQS